MTEISPDPSARAPMRTELVAIATDTVPLDGAYYEPAGATRAAALLMHGNCMNFYVGAPRFLPPRLTARGFACLAYNRRGHDVLSTRASRTLEGGAFQTVAQARADNAYASDWLAARGHANPVLVGHSHGGVLAARHAVDRAHPPALVLLSAHRGGERIAERISAHGLWARERYHEIERAARALVDGGRPEELLLLPGWWHAISAASALDFATAVPDLLELAPRIRCPVLYLRGALEPEDLYPAEAFAQRCAGPCEIAVIPGCDHFYNGCELAVADVVCDWLDRVLAR